jgi:hypothetical protein
MVRGPGYETDQRKGESAGRERTAEAEIGRLTGALVTTNRIDLTGALRDFQSTRSLPDYFLPSRWRFAQFFFRRVLLATSCLAPRLRTGREQDESGRPKREGATRRIPRDLCATIDASWALRCAALSKRSGRFERSQRKNNQLKRHNARALRCARPRAICQSTSLLICVSSLRRIEQYVACRIEDACVFLRDSVFDAFVSAQKKRVKHLAKH